MQTAFHTLTATRTLMLFRSRRDRGRLRRGGGGPEDIVEEIGLRGGWRRDERRNNAKEGKTRGEGNIAAIVPAVAVGDSPSGNT